jgi:hypothetical protein
LDTYGEETGDITGQGEADVEEHLRKDYKWVRNEQINLTKFDIAEFRSISKVSIRTVNKERRLKQSHTPSCALLSTK